MKKIVTFLLLALMVGTSALEARGGGAGHGGGYYRGGGRGYGGYYGGGWGPYYGGYGYGIGTGLAVGAVTGAAIASANQDPVATEEARAMRSERKEREREARDRRKYGNKRSRTEDTGRPATRGKRNYGGGRTKRSTAEIDAHIQQLQEERKAAAAAA